MIRLGCHGHLADPPVESYLSLTDGRLQVGDMLDQARRRVVGAPGALVVLAACTSDATDALLDESLSLATAFLAAGASGVVGARWAVADIPTAVFMTMFHHYLNSGYPDPAVALRATQVWMIEGSGRLPTGLDPVLADEITRLDLAGVEHWGAFTYQGR
jgi:CHAT domain-containing protein